MSMIINTIINVLLKWLHGITAEQWAKAIAFVIRAAAQKITDEQKRQFVVDSLTTEVNLTESAANFVTELAYSYAVKKNLLPE